jgi:hypothetical protein
MAASFERAVQHAQPFSHPGQPVPAVQARSCGRRGFSGEVVAYGQPDISVGVVEAEANTLAGRVPSGVDQAFLGDAKQRDRGLQR